MDAELEVDDNPEVAAATLQGPQQIGIFGFTGADQPAVGRDHIRRQEDCRSSGPCVPRSQPMPPDRVRPATPVAEISPPGVARPKGVVAASTSRQVAPPSTKARSRPGDPDAVHQRKVDHHAAIADRIARHIVPAAADGDGETCFTGVVDGSATSAALRQRTINAGRRSIMPFQTPRASS